MFDDIPRPTCRRVYTVSDERFRHGGSGYETILPFRGVGESCNIPHQGLGLNPRSRNVLPECSEVLGLYNFGVRFNIRCVVQKI